MIDKIPFRVSPKMIGWIILLGILVGSSFQAYRFITMFKFVDEYNNWVPAALMHQGKTLYTNIFYNRMPLPAYISYILQFFISPQADYYRVIQIHRIFMIAFSASWIVFMYAYFKKSWVLIFALMFELLKPYIFGFSFQAEAMVVYPLVFLFIQSVTAKRWSVPILLFSGVCMWFALFSRETTIVTVGMIYAVMCLSIRDIKKIVILTSLPVALSLLTLATMDVSGWFFEMVTVNKITFQSEISHASGITGIAGSLLLPFQYISTLFMTQASNFQRTIGVQIIFLIVLIIVYIRKRIVSLPYSVLLIAYLLLVLFSSALRSPMPERELWAIYRLIPWIGIILATVAYLVGEYTTKYRTVFISISLLLVVSYYLHPNSLLLKQVDRVREYDISYFNDVSYGHAIEESTDAQDNVFVIGYSSHIYMLSHRNTTYPDTFFYPIHYSIPLYQEKVLKMLRSNPPILIFTTDCNSEVIVKSVKLEILKNYTRLLKDKKLTCLYVKNDRLEKITNMLINKGFSK
ncbi:MAG: hypothetical protein WCO78_03385 [Candidatus Roizmanbacteria bacterium]